MEKANSARRGQIAPKRASRVTVPARCHPAAKIVFAEMGRQGVTYDELEFYSGVLTSTVKAWRHHNAPGLNTLAATLGYLGWDLVPVPRSKHLPPKLVERLDALAAEWGPQLAPLHAQLISSAVRAPDTEPLTTAGASRRPDHHQPAALAA